MCSQRATMSIQSGVTSLAPILFEFKFSDLGVTALC
jgi:hypothetical protein